jgi:hypothetical protein
MFFKNLNITFMKNSISIFRIGLFVASLFIFTQCEDQFMKEAASMKGPGKGGGGSGGGEPIESVGANLSFPVIWSEGVEKTLRVAPADAVNGVKLAGAWWYVWGEDPIDPQAPIFSCNPLALGTTCYGTATDVYKAYLQKDANNYWEAYNAAAETRMNVDLVDWGDNLESVNWSTTSKVRTEVVLYENLTNPVLQYAMRHVSGWGTDEMHGLQTTLNGEIVYGPGTQATVYSPHARLTIQKLTTATPTNLVWNATTHAWTGAVSAPVFNKAVWEAADGPGYYNAEVNIKGKIIYGYTWDVKKANSGAGVYRITFSFDQTAGSVSPNLNTYFDGSTQVLVPIEEEVVVEEEGGPGGGGKANIDVRNNLTYIDVTITSGQSGGGSGGGKGKPTK